MLTSIIQIDTKAVAEARGYKNPGSVANRITRLKKRYNLPITASGSKKTDSSPASEARVPVTPSKSKVTKARTTRGRAVKITKKLVKSDDESSGEDNGMITAAPKKAGKFATAAGSGEWSGDDEEGVFACKDQKGLKSSGVDEGEVADDGEDGDDMETSETLNVEGDNENEV